MKAAAFLMVGLVLIPGFRTVSADPAAKEAGAAQITAMAGEGGPGLPIRFPVIFEVNMEVQKLLGNFNPATDQVEVRASVDGAPFNLRLGHVTSPDTNIFGNAIHLAFSPGAVMEYKFAILRPGGVIEEGNVGPGTSGSRTLVLGPAPNKGPRVYFDNKIVKPGPGIPVIFQVRAGVLGRALLASGAGTMSVAGEFNNWSATATPLERSMTNDAVFISGVRIQAEPGTVIPFKFVANGGTGGETFESGENRTFVLEVVEGAEQVLPMFFFNREVDRRTLYFTRGPFSNAAVDVRATEVVLHWGAFAEWNLQRAPSLAGPWEDVPGTPGKGWETVPMNVGSGFFRLKGPLP